jgi:1-acyl-sn-glycerol-3-phosphate acyltransferase
MGSGTPGGGNDRHLTGEGQQIQKIQGGLRFNHILIQAFTVTVLHKIANRIAAVSMKAVFGAVAQIRVIRRDNADRSGGMLLAANHISHFDPFIISAVVRRKIDWMAMAEFFPYPVLGQFLRAVDAFPAARDRADSNTIRSAIHRLRSGRIVGIFPEGGIRDGSRSILQGAATRAGVAALADIAGVPILPCVILGSDRLYHRRRWTRFRQTPIWIAFGHPIYRDLSLGKTAAREQIGSQFAAAIDRLRCEISDAFQLDPTDFPQPPRVRMQESVR